MEFKEFRYFKVISVNDKNVKNGGRYKTKSSPYDVAVKIFRYLCKKYKSNKLKFMIKEITQNSSKKVFGPYLGRKQKLKNPLEILRNGKLVKYKYGRPNIRLIKNKKGGSNAPKNNSINRFVNLSINNDNNHNDNSTKSNNNSNNFTKINSKNVKSVNIYAIYGQSTSAKDSINNNKSLCECLLNWIKNNGKILNYIILCGPSDEKSEMKHYLSINSKRKINRRLYENNYEYFCGYPICIYNTDYNDKKLILIELCEEEEYRRKVNNNNFKKIEKNAPNTRSSSAGSLNTFENMLELFTCFAYLKENPVLNKFTPNDIYHCAGSGKAQVARAIHNILPFRFNESLGKKQIQFFQNLLTNNDIDLTEKLHNKKTYFGKANKQKNIKTFEEIFKEYSDKLNETFINDTLEKQKNQTFNSTRSIIKSLWSPYWEEACKDNPLDKLSNFEDDIKKNIIKFQNGDKEIINLFFDMLYPRNENQQFTGLLYYLNSINKKGSLIPIRTEIRDVVDEFKTWSLNWENWHNDKYISYLDHENSEFGKSLFKDRLKIDITTAVNYLAGWNKGDIAKSHFALMFSPYPEKFPQSVRTY